MMEYTPNAGGAEHHTRATSRLYSIMKCSADVRNPDGAVTFFRLEQDERPRRFKTKRYVRLRSCARAPYTYTQAPAYAVVSELLRSACIRTGRACPNRLDNPRCRLV